MRNFFLYFIVIFFLHEGIAQTNDTIFNIKYSQLIEIKGETDLYLKDASQTLSNFLFYRDKNLILNESDIDTNYIDFIFEYLFVYNSLPNEYLNFFIYQVYGDKDNGYDFSVLLTHDYSLYPKEQQDFTLYYIYKARVVFVDGDFKLDISPQYNYSFSINKINYFYNSKNERSKKSIRLASLFIKSLEKKYQFKQKKKLNYYVSNNNSEIYASLGFEFLLFSSNLFSKRTSSLYSNKNGEFNKHELTHYFFQDFKLDKFLAEGLAVYYNIEFENIDQKLNTVKKHLTTLTKEEKNEWIENYLEGKYLGGIYQNFFYSISGLLISDYLKQNNEIKLKEILVTEPNITPKEFISKHLDNPLDPVKYIWRKII